MRQQLKKIERQLIKWYDRYTSALKTRNVSFFWLLLSASLVAVLSLPIWYWTFEQTIPIEVKLSAPGSEIVRAYWNHPSMFPDAYESIIVNPVESQQWQVTVEALGEKNPKSDGFEVALLDMRTPQGQIDWSAGEFLAGDWEFRLDPDGPQGKVAIAHSNKPEYGQNPGQTQSFSIPIQGGDLDIRFLSNAGSGKVRITINNNVRELDLYSSNLRYEDVSFPALAVGDRTVREYTFQLVDSFWGKLKFATQDRDKISIMEVRANGEILKQNGKGEYILNFRWNNRTLLSALASFLTLGIIILISLEFFEDLKIVLSVTLFAMIWLYIFFSFKVVVLNTLPNFIFLSIWYLFVKTEYSQKRFWFFFISGSFLVLRLPITAGRSLELINWIIYFFILFLVFKKIFQYFRIRRKLTLAIATLIILWFNAFSHISLNSPYTYVNRSIDFYWQCPHETYQFMVNCDHGHYLAEEFIFTTDDYDASFSVKLRRFFYGYLSSLIGFSGHRWIASFSLNLLFWMLSCVALYKTCILLKLGERIASISMLCCASSWGFVSFVGQPAMYMTAYAYAAITIWTTVEILYAKSKQKIVLFSLIIISGTLVYDIYPITLSSFLVLFLYRNKVTALSILIGQFGISFIWKNFYLAKVLGTIGDQGNVRVATDSLKIWSDIIKNLDISQALHWIIRGTHSFIYGNMIFGFIAGSVFIIVLTIKWMKHQDNESDRLLLLFSSLIYLLVWLATLATIPKASEWGMGGGMLPRLAFYSYPISTIALVFCGNILGKKKSYTIPILTFLIANIDITGLATVATFFDYGMIGIYWK